MRLSALDALHYYFTRAGNILEATDLCAVIAIDSGEQSPTFADIRDVLAGRIGLLPALQERIEPAPGDLTYPHWVRDPEHARNKITEAMGSRWSDVLDHVVAASANPVDPTRSPWRIVVWRNVTGVPDVANRATIVFLQVSHALTDGRGITQIQRALFGDDAAAARVPGHGNPSASMGFRQSLSELRSVPRNLFRASRQARALTGRPKTDARAKIEAIEPLNSAGERREFLDIRVVPVKDLRWAGTVTETGLTAVSLAMESYLAELDAIPESGAIIAQVPVVPDGIADVELPVPSANVASSSVLVDLAIGIDDRDERMQLIKDSLRKGLVDHAGEDHLVQRQLFEHLPVQVVRSNAELSLRTTPSSLICHTNFTSYRKGAADLSLLGGPVVFVGGPPLLRRNMGLTQAMVGLGDRVAVCITASDSVPRPDLYAELLHAAIRREL